MLEQLNVKAKVVHAWDGVGEHSRGKIEAVLVVMQGFLEDNGLGEGWEGIDLSRESQASISYRIC